MHMPCTHISLIICLPTECNHLFKALAQFLAHFKEVIFLREASRETWWRDHWHLSLILHKTQPQWKQRNTSSYKSTKEGTAYEQFQLYSAKVSEERASIWLGRLEKVTTYVSTDENPTTKWAKWVCSITESQHLEEPGMTEGLGSWVLVQRQQCWSKY